MTHILFGLTIGIPFIKILEMNCLEGIGIYIVGLLIGSLLPDADHPSAPIGKVIPLWLFCKHRTITHSVLMIASVALVAKLNNYFGFGLLLGVISHILLDTFNYTGCPISYPIIKDNISLAKIDIKGKTAANLTLLFLCLVLLEAYFVIKYLGINYTGLFNTTF